MRTHHALLLTLMFAAGCGIEGLYMEIPPYQPQDAGADANPDADVIDADIGSPDIGPDADAAHDADAPLTLAPPANLRTEQGTESLTLRWDAVSGATAYEVRIDQGDWITLGDVTSYEDTEAPAPTMTGDPQLTTTEGTLRPHVALTTTLPTLTTPTPRTYDVRAGRRRDERTRLGRGDAHARRLGADMGTQPR